MIAEKRKNEFEAKGQPKNNKSLPHSGRLVSQVFLWAKAFHTWDGYLGTVPRTLTLHLSCNFCLPAPDSIRVSFGVIRFAIQSFTWFTISAEAHLRKRRRVYQVKWTLFQIVNWRDTLKSRRPLLRDLPSKTRPPISEKTDPVIKLFVYTILV